MGLAPCPLPAGSIGALGVRRGAGSSGGRRAMVAGGGSGRRRVARHARAGGHLWPAVGSEGDPRLRGDDGEVIDAPGLTRGIDGRALTIRAPGQARDIGVAAAAGGAFSVGVPAQGRDIGVAGVVPRSLRVRPGHGAGRRVRACTHRWPFGISAVVRASTHPTGRRPAGVCTHVPKWDTPENPSVSTSCKPVHCTHPLHGPLDAPLTARRYRPAARGRSAGT